ncbi:NAD-dependent deacylase [Marivirga harenae]|uniref:SIR2 family NAD-dependent protein deacylase n=1 Tax=Marivirga harenae TaxID=2010992 RepID=UPI0026DEB323|nr:NAD-dependent deacylase [Marivirga harenae]WKV11659.1 NAD-dependent deacylase [Marivirga harenae]|tara:strand:+ start:166115 stop:166807 length:693 start_codon:yes stop_codon:yes gene_type:complete
MRKNLVVLTGAGISAESGIPTFRGTDGLWEGHDVMEVASPQGWAKNQSLVLDFYNQRRKAVLDAEPNEAHKMLAELEKDYDVQIITQNIDDLHERGGSSKVLHLHGEIKKARSCVDENLIYELNGWEIKEGDLCEKGSQLRPHIVWFGEMVPMIEPAARITAKADVLLVVGTSLQVYPAASLIHEVQRNIPIYVIDPSTPEYYGTNQITAIAKGAVEGMKEAKEKLIASC